MVMKETTTPIQYKYIRGRHRYSGRAKVRKASRTIAIPVRKSVTAKFMVMTLIWKFILFVWAKISKASKFKETIVIPDNMEGIFCGRSNRLWSVVFLSMLVPCSSIETYAYSVKTTALYMSSLSCFYVSGCLVLTLSAMCHAYSYIRKTVMKGFLFVA